MIRNIPALALQTSLDEVGDKIVAIINENPELYDERDVIKVKADNSWFLKRFLLDKDGKVPLAVDGLQKCLNWRQSLRVNDILQELFPLEFYESGVLGLGTDKDGLQVFYMRLALNKPFPELQATIKRLIIYVIDQLDVRANGGQFGLVFDLKSAGVANIDLALVKSLITEVFDYFPLALAYICLHEPAWYLKPFISMLTALVPNKYRKLIVYTNETSLKERIGDRCLPSYLGGKAVVSMNAMMPLKTPPFADWAKEHGVSEATVSAFQVLYKKNRSQLQEETLLHCAN